MNLNQLQLLLRIVYLILCKSFVRCKLTFHMSCCYLFVSLFLASHVLLLDNRNTVNIKTCNRSTNTDKTSYIPQFGITEPCHRGRCTRICSNSVPLVPIYLSEKTRLCVGTSALVIFRDKKLDSSCWNSAHTVSEGKLY